MPIASILRWSSALLAALGAAAALAQPAAPPSIAQKSAPAAATAPAADAPAEPIPLAEVPAQAASVASELRAIDAELAGDSRVARITAALPEMARDIDQRRDETTRLTGRDTALPALRAQDQGWGVVRGTLDGWRRELAARVDTLDKEAARLAELERRWRATVPLASRPDAPPAVRGRVDETLAAIRAARSTLDKRRAETLALLDRVATQDARAADAVALLDAAKKKALGGLLTRQARPLWDLNAPTDLRPAQDAPPAYGAQVQALVRYALEERDLLALHLLVTIIVAAGLFAVRRRINAWSEQVPALAPTRGVFDRPIAAALVLTMLTSRSLYVEAPTVFWSLVGAITILATVLVLRRIADPRLFPVLNGVVAFFVFDQARNLAGPLVVQPRLVFLLEMAAGALFSLWLLRKARTEGATRSPLDRWLGVGARITLVAFAAAFVANAFGFTSLGDVLGRSVLGSAYVGVIFYAAVLIIDALVLLALHARPLNLSRMVRLHADAIWQRVRRLVRWVAIILWALIALDRLSLREGFFNGTAAVLGAGVRVGALDIAIGDVVAFVLALWAAALISRFTRFVLEEDVFPRVSLPRGLPYAITTSLHYTILMVGFLAGVAALGVDMTKLTILVGAFTVGVGFGLQNIINNFVSGLILLFERPVKVSDVIQVDDAVGVVQRIGIRATVIRTAAGAEVIVPNGKLISERLTNWTRSTNYRPIEIPLAVAGGSDPREITKLLARAAAAQPGVLETPAPQVLLTKLGLDAVLFEVRVWTDRADDWTEVKSDVILALHEALAAAKIAIRNLPP